MYMFASHPLDENNSWMRITNMQHTIIEKWVNGISVDKNRSLRGNKLEVMDTDFMKQHHHVAQISIRAFRNVQNWQCWLVTIELGTSVVPV